MLGELFLPVRFAVKGKVRVPVRHRDIGMANHLFHIFETGAGKKKVGTEGVPQIMEVKIRDTRDPTGLAPCAVKPEQALTI